VNTILFLDFDGVINSTRSILRAEKTTPTWPERDFALELGKQYYVGYPEDLLVLDLRGIDPICVGYLNQIIEASKASVVVSSSWRFCHNIVGMQKLLEYHGFKGQLIDITPVNVKAPQKLRGYEIQAWLDLHPEVENMAILDDDTDMAHLSQYLVRTDLAVGLTEENARQAISILVPVRSVGI
jgi:hypothetical protein